MRIACITFVIVLLPFVAAIPEIPPRVPRDCFDVNRSNDQFEGHYVLYPDNPDKPTLVFCSIDDGMLPLNSSAPKASAKNCQDLYDAGMHESGLNAIYPYVDHPKSPVLVFCDQVLLGGGWTVFQRRDEYQTQLDFYKTFDEYSFGFGNVETEFWLGLDAIHELTQQSVNELYIDMTSFDDVNKYAHYKTFSVGPKEPTAAGLSEHPYYLLVSHYEGTAGDSLSYHNGWGFSTRDADHDNSDNHCASGSWQGAWWYSACAHSNLNGMFSGSGASSINWDTFDPQFFSKRLRAVTMSLRPLKQQ